MDIQCFSDYACPFCYIGEVRLKKAIAALDGGDDVFFIPRAFELDPDAPDEPLGDSASRIARKYGLTLEEAKKRVAQISAIGRADGIDFRYADSQYTNTFNAHRLMKLALSKLDRRIAEKTNHGLFDAYFTKGLRLSDRSTLIDVGLAAGLTQSEIVAMLDSDLYGDEVRHDERDAANLGITSVPCFIMPGISAIRGAVSVEAFKDSFRQSAATAGQGMQCGPDGCQLRD